MQTLFFLVVCLLLASCEAVQWAAHAVTGGIVPAPTPGSNEAGAQVWSAWLTWLGSWFGITDPQAATAVTVAAYSRLDNVVKGVIGTTKATHRAVTRRRKTKADKAGLAASKTRQAEGSPAP